MLWVIGNLLAAAAAWLLSHVLRRRRRAQQLAMLADEPARTVSTPAEPEGEPVADHGEDEGIGEDAEPGVAKMIPRQRRQSPDVSVDPDDGVRTRVRRG